MTLVSLITPDGRTLVAEFARVPAANERIVLDAIAAPEDTDQWPDDLHGKRFHVGGVTWAAPAPMLEARPLCTLVGPEK